MNWKVRFVDWLDIQIQRYKRYLATSDCRNYGHQWAHAGGANCGCEPDGCCSIPVMVCKGCGDCDYGVNAEAQATIEECQRLREDTNFVETNYGESK